MVLLSLDCKMSWNKWSFKLAPDPKWYVNHKPILNECHLILSLSSLGHQKIWIKIKYTKYVLFGLGLNIRLEISFLHKKCQARIPRNPAWICQDPAGSDCILHPLCGPNFTDMAQPLSIMLIINEGSLLVWGKHADSQLAFTPTICFPSKLTPHGYLF